MAGAAIITAATFTSPAAADSTTPLTPKAAAGLPNVTFGSRADQLGEGTIWAKDRYGNVVAEAHWQADPGGTQYPKGDTLYVSDFMADGLDPRGEASIGIKISPSGSGDRVQQTKNVAEGTKLHINLCMSNSSGTLCSPGLAVKA
ncbi:hypothetical protein ACFYXH_38760 [Streptomyces sp. NPDC002730]|uniref:hypothetical protein n=1 Tax=Streptomyces sp. NPDC002730 TaxID=3364662 RepID=UPI0036A6D9F0